MLGVDISWKYSYSPHLMHGHVRIIVAIEGSNMVGYKFSAMRAGT